MEFTAVKDHCSQISCWLLCHYNTENTCSTQRQCWSVSVDAHTVLGRGRTGEEKRESQNSCFCCFKSWYGYRVSVGSSWYFFGGRNLAIDWLKTHCDAFITYMKRSSIVWKCILVLGHFNIILNLFNLLGNVISRRYSILNPFNLLYFPCHKYTIIPLVFG